MRLQDVILVVKEVHVRIKADSIPISVSAIKTYISDTLKIKFDMFDRVSWKANQILARLLRYEVNGQKSAKIAISDSLNTCWTRLVVCKELAHLLIDNEARGDFTTNPIELVQSLLGTFSIDEDIPSEKAAIHAAAELLIPWTTQSAILERIASGQSSYDVALHYRVPERLIDIWRSPNYQRLLGEAWVEMDKDHPPINTSKR